MMIIKFPFVMVVVIVVKYSGCHKVKLINPGELVDLRIMGCKDGKWHDFVNGASFPEDAVVELTPGNVTEFVCVRGTEMETMVMIMMKQGMTFLSDRSEGRWRSENVTLVCSVEVWTQTLKQFHLSIVSKSRKKETIVNKVSAIRDGSLVSMTVNYTYHDDDNDDDDGEDDGGDDDGGGGDDYDNGNDDLSYSCNWEIQFDESEREREIIESQNLKVKIFEPVNRVRPGSTTIASNTTLQCLAEGFPAPHLCTCDLRTLPNHTHLSPGGSTLQPGSYLVTCLAKNSIRGEIYNSTWIGYLDVQSKKSCGLRLAKETKKMSHGFGKQCLFVTTLLQIFSFGKKIEIVIARPYENLTICEPPLITMLTSSLVPFVGPVEIGLENVGRYVCLKNTSDIGVFVRLLALEQPLQLEIENTTLIHLQPINITCSLVLWQSRDTLENIITIRHGVTLVSRKEFFRHEKRLDMRVQTIFRPSFHDGNLFRCQWSLKEIWGSSWVKKDVEVVFQKRSIIIPATNVRPSTVDAKIGQPIKCLYDGSETDQIAWNVVDKSVPDHVIEGMVKDVLRVMEVGEFEVICEVNSTQEIGDLWKGKLKISSHDFNNSNLPLSYAFALQYGQTVLNSPFCQSNSMVYWLTQSHHVTGVIEKVDESHAGIYGCLIGFEVVGLLRLIVLKQNLTLTIPRTSFITDEIVELNCSVSAWFGRGRITSQLELYQSDGTSLKKSTASVQGAEILNLHTWYDLRAELEDSGRKFVCRWSLSEMIRDMEEFRSSFVVEDSFQVWNIIRPSNIRPNATTTYIDMVVLCSNEARLEEICTWKSLEPVAKHVKPKWSFLGAALVIHKTGTFAFQCRCIDPELNRETNLPWAGEIRILARGGVKSLGVADAQLVYVSSVAENLKAEYGFLVVRILQVIIAFDQI